MAILTTAQLRLCQTSLRTDPDARTEMRAKALSRAQWVAALQALEDRWEASRLATKTAMEAAAGTTFTNTLAKKLAKAWMDMKYRGE